MSANGSHNSLLNEFPQYQHTGLINYSGQNTKKLYCEINYSRPNFQGIPKLTEDEARAALISYASENCCLGKGLLKEIGFRNLQSLNSYRYVLETFIESRSTKYVHEPYIGQLIMHNGSNPPHPWDIAVEPDNLFLNHTKFLMIPNTAQVKSCNTCRGIGINSCSSCNGRGYRPCLKCHGNGQNNNINNHPEKCLKCDGQAKIICIRCSGNGRNTCHKCDGSGKLLWYLQLEISFINFAEEYVKKTELLPESLIKNTDSKNIFTEEDDCLNPITNHPDQDINDASQKLLNSHYERFSSCRILMQKHEIFVIPITACVYKWKEKNFTFYVYGFGNVVYSPDYPKKCSSCTIA